MDAMLSLAPDGCFQSFMDLVGPLMLLGTGTGLLAWFAGGIWDAVLVLFRV